MPRMTYLGCSGICILVTTALFGQHLPKNPTHQQVVSYYLQQQREWNLKQLPASSVLFKAASRYKTGLNYTVGWKADDLPAYHTPYGFTIRNAPDGQTLGKNNYYDYRNSPFLKNYLQREIPKFMYRPAHLAYREENIGSMILREILFPPLKVNQR